MMTYRSPENLPSMECKQCGLNHPMLPEGEKCPMAKEHTTDGSEINYEQFMRNIKNITSSQIKCKGIKDPNKMFAELTVQFMKMVEKYEESN